MQGTRDMDHKGIDCHAIVDAEAVENLAQKKAQLCRETRKFLKQYDTEGSQKKRLKREKNKKVMHDMQRRSEEMLRQTKEMFRVSEAIRRKALRLREQSGLLLEQIEDDLRSLAEDTHEAPP